MNDLNIHRKPGLYDCRCLPMADPVVEIVDLIYWSVTSITTIVLKHITGLTILAQKYLFSAVMNMVYC